jgi:exosortase A-associated hydrolase 1
MTAKEQVLSFPVAGSYCQGILHVPLSASSRGVLVVVGGPQYRVGSHRQFVLLARFLAEQGIPVLRFDYRSMGDSDGEARDFEAVQDDIRAAVDAFFTQYAGLEEVVIWGLCDAASAASFYAAQDSRVGGLVLLNPWVRTEAGIAKAYLKHYYLSRLFDPDLWRKVMRGEFELTASVKSLFQMVTSVIAPGKETGEQNESGDTSPASNVEPPNTPLPERMYQGLKAFQGPMLFILSGDDLTADEFRDVVGQSKAWRQLLDQPRVMVHELAEANHTFSRRQWRDRVAQWTLDWLRSW